MANFVANKAKVIAELNKNSDEFIESWKQQVRNQRATIIGNRQCVLTDLCNASKSLKSATPNTPVTIEEAHGKMLVELRAKTSTDIIESWKAAAMEQKRQMLATRHQILSAVGQKQSLRKRSTSFIEQRQAVMNQLKTEPVPEWKEKIMTEKMRVYSNRNACMNAIKGARATLKCKDDLVVKRARVMDQLRAQSQPVESWKQSIRNTIATPMVNKQLLLAAIPTQPTLKSTKNPRVELLNQLKATLQGHEVTPEWKEKQQTQRRQTMELKQKLNFTIPTAKLVAKPNHTQLMAEIRVSAFTIQIPEHTLVVESWKQQVRDQKAAAIQAKKSVLVSLTESKPKLTSIKKDTHAELMNAIRATPLEAWKQALYRFRAQAIANKHQLVAEIEAANFKLTPSKNVAENKITCLSQLRHSTGNIVEAWKEAERNTRAKQIGAKHFMFAELKAKKSTSLKSTKTTEQKKIDVLKELREKTTEQLPAWQEAERVERANVQNHHHAMICELSTTNKKEVIENVQPINEIKRAVLSEIRRKLPVEGWKEQERVKQASLYNNRRAVVEEIACGKVTNNRSQVELKEAMLKEIRSKGECPVPEWKENRMGQRLQVLKNKTLLNQQICSRMVL